MPTRRGARTISPPILRPARTAGVTLIEQPLPAHDDGGACAIARPIPVCADESVHRPRVACLARRQIRRRQHQARQDRRPDRSAGDGGGGRAARLCASWSAAWWRPRSRWRPRCWSRSARAWSISTGRCCSRAIARTGCVTRAASFIRRRPRCGADRLAAKNQARYFGFVRLIIACEEYKLPKSWAGRICIPKFSVF